MTNALRATAVAYGVAVAVHIGDHVRRGLDASPRVVLALGTFALLLQATAVVAVLARHALAPVIALAVTVPNTIGVVAVHLLPRWSGLSDAFPGADRAPGVTAFSWVTAIAEVVTGLLFAYAAWTAWNAARPGAPGSGGRASAVKTS